MGTTTLEEVAAAAPDPSQHMFKLYVIKDRDFTRQLVQVCVKAMRTSHPWSIAQVWNNQQFCALVGRMLPKPSMQSTPCLQ